MVATNFSQSANQQLAYNQNIDQNGDPKARRSKGNQTYKHTCHQKLVGDGVHNLPQPAFDLPTPGKIAVEEVRKRCEREQNQGYPSHKRLL